jgi:hypothetical protein
VICLRTTKRLVADQSNHAVPAGMHGVGEWQLVRRRGHAARTHAAVTADSHSELGPTGPSVGAGFGRSRGGWRSAVQCSAGQGRAGPCLGSSGARRRRSRRPWHRRRRPACSTARALSRALAAGCRPRTMRRTPPYSAPRGPRQTLTSGPARPACSAATARKVRRRQVLARRGRAGCKAHLLLPASQPRTLPPFSFPCRGRCD